MVANIPTDASRMKDAALQAVAQLPTCTSISWYNAPMSTDLKHAVEELKQLPEEQQTTIIERLQDMVSRAKIDASLAQAEARGGETPADVFFAELRKQYGG